MLLRIGSTKIYFSNGKIIPDIYLINYVLVCTIPKLLFDFVSFIEKHRAVLFRRPVCM